MAFQGSPKRRPYGEPRESEGSGRPPLLPRDPGSHRMVIGLLETWQLLLKSDSCGPVASKIDVSSTPGLCVGLDLGCFPGFCMTRLLHSYEGVYLNEPRISSPIQTGDLVLNLFSGTFHSGFRVPTLLKEAKGLAPFKPSFLTPSGTCLLPDGDTSASNRCRPQDRVIAKDSIWSLSSGHRTCLPPPHVGSLGLA